MTQSFEHAGHDVYFDTFATKTFSLHFDCAAVKELGQLRVSELVLPDTFPCGVTIEAAKKNPFHQMKLFIDVKTADYESHTV